jgi:hypothetical protein
MNAKGVSHTGLQRTFFVAGLAVLMLLVCTSPQAMAQDRAAHQMRFKICQPIEFPGRVLEPGTYYIRRNLPPLREGTDTMIQVLDESQRHVLVTTMARPARRLANTEGVSFIFYEASVGTPQPVRTWYLPGDVLGYDFIYPKDHLEQVAAHATTPTTTAEVSYSPLPAPEAPPQRAEVLPPPAPQENVQPPQEVAPVPEETPAELPKTAGELPILVLLAGLSLLGSGILRFARRS